MIPARGAINQRAMAMDAHIQNVVKAIVPWMKLTVTLKVPVPEEVHAINADTTILANHAAASGVL